MKHKKGSVLLVQRANIEHYPPVMHQLRMLEEQSHVRVLDRVSQKDEKEAILPGDTERVRVRISARRDGSISLKHRLEEGFAFAKALNREIARKPDLAIAYDPDAASLLLRKKSSPGLKRIVHLHEMLEPATSGRTTRLSIRYLERHLNRADLVIVPDSERARIIAGQFGLTTDPTVVMNCPPLLSAIPESRLIPELQKRDVSPSGIVHYQGAIGRDHYLEDVIQSMIHWPAGSIFVVVGGSEGDYRAHLRQIAESVGMSSRVQYVDRVPYAEVLSYAVGATIGITLLEPRIKNWQFSAGASNKRFEYASLGIAQVTNGGPGMEELFGQTQIASLLDSVDPESIGREIARLLTNPAVSAAMGACARAAHLRANNYEAQFAPVLQIIDGWLSNAS